MSNKRQWILHAEHTYLLSLFIFIFYINVWSIYFIYQDVLFRWHCLALKLMRGDLNNISVWNIANNCYIYVIYNVPMVSVFWTIWIEKKINTSRCILLFFFNMKPETLVIFFYDDFDFWYLMPLSTIFQLYHQTWRPVLVVEEADVPEENHRPWANNW